MATNYGHPNMPKIVRALTGGRAGDRTTLLLPGTSSATLTIGGFVPWLDGTGVAAALAAEGGIKAFADDDFIGGFIVGFRTADNQSPLDDVNRQGTITDGTVVIPYKYTFNAANDQLSGTSAKNEMVEFLPIYRGDIIEVSLFNDGGTATVNRGTTTASGTTGSSAHLGVGMSVLVGAQVGLQESTASVTYTNLDFMVTLVDGNQPDRLDRVYVTLLRAGENAVAAS